MKTEFLRKATLAGAALMLAAGSAFAAPKEDPGKKTYDTKCASCHGKDGKGNANMAKTFKVAPEALNLAAGDAVGKTDEELLKVIADGKNKMPAYSKQLKPADRDAVLKYVRTLQPAKPAK